MPSPDNLTKLRAFIGLINYYERFIRNLSDMLRPLNNLLKKNVPFRWSKACELAFSKAKAEFESDKILVPFDPKLPLVLATDASPCGSCTITHISRRKRAYYTMCFKFIDGNAKKKIRTNR